MKNKKKCNTCRKYNKCQYGIRNKSDNRKFLCEPKIKNLTDIPKEVFEPIYKKYSILESAKRLKISKGGVSKLAKIYNLSKNNVMR